MSNDREGWLTREQIKTHLERWKVGLDSPQMDTLCRMALAALDAPADERLREAARNLIDATEPWEHGCSCQEDDEDQNGPCDVCRLHEAVANLEAALSTPKAPAQGSECLHGCEGKGWYWTGKQTGCVLAPCPIHAPKPEAATEMCARCGHPKHEHEAINQFEQDGKCNAGYGACYHFTPDPKERCEICGKEKDLMNEHFFPDMPRAHPFTPAPKEQQP